jgi:hypothetical protein
MVTRQATAFLKKHSHCPDCGQRYLQKGQHALIFRTLFDKLSLKSPRLFHCPDHPQAQKTFSPLPALFPERISPELLYLESKWASLMSYGMSTKLLQDVLPIDEQVNPATIRNHLQRVAKRLDEGLGEERVMFVDGCPLDWAAQPRPEGPIYVGLDGGYVRGWSDKKANFEVIVGKSMPQERTAKCFGFVQTLDEKPKRRLFELLKSQGMQSNQQVIFLSDGAETLRNLQYYLNPHSEHILDWFHITMRLTVLSNCTKGIQEMKKSIGQEAVKAVESVKWHLWHGNTHDALERLDDLAHAFDPDRWDDQEQEVWNAQQKPKLVKALGYATEFQTYIERNVQFIVDYGERFRFKEPISTGFVESAVNYVVSKRFSKRQQMQWTPQGAHALLQVRTKVLNGDWQATFSNWYPELNPASSNLEEVPIAA